LGLCGASATACSFGHKWPVELRDGRVRVEVSLTPLFVTSDQLAV
jgi:hypothetical protein